MGITGTASWVDGVHEERHPSHVLPRNQHSELGNEGVGYACVRAISSRVHTPCVAFTVKLWDISSSHRKKTRRAGTGPVTIWLKAAMKQICRVWRAAYIHGKSESGEYKEAITFRAAANRHSLWEVQNAES